VDRARVVRVWIAALAIAGETTADPVVDQSFEGPILSTTTVFDQQEIAQTFTVGSPGVITMLDIGLTRTEPGPVDGLVVRLNSPLFGYTLGTVQVPAGAVIPASSGPWTTVDFRSQPVFVSAGQALGIAVTTADPLGGGEYNWVGSTEDTAYLAGTSYWSTPVTGWNSWPGDNARDFLFRVFVDPEPALDPVAILGAWPDRVRLAYSDNGSVDQRLLKMASIGDKAVVLAGGDKPSPSKAIKTLGKALKILADLVDEYSGDALLLQIERGHRFLLRRFAAQAIEDAEDAGGDEGLLLAASGLLGEGDAAIDAEDAKGAVKLWGKAAKTAAKAAARVD